MKYMNFAAAALSLILITLSASAQSTSTQIDRKYLCGTTLSGESVLCSESQILEALKILRESRTNSAGNIDGIAGKVIFFSGVTLTTSPWLLILATELVPWLDPVTSFIASRLSATTVFVGGPLLTATGAVIWAMSPTPAAASTIDAYLARPEGMILLLDMTDEQVLYYLHLNPEIARNIIGTATALANASR